MSTAAPKHIRTTTMIIGVTAAVAIIAAVAITLRDGPPVDPGLTGPVRPIRAAAKDNALDSAPGDSSLTPESVGLLRESITSALAAVNEPGFVDAAPTAVEYALAIADGDVDRLLGLALEHGGKPNESLAEMFRTFADARPDRLRPRDIEHWNAVQVFRWAATTLTARSVWTGVNFERVAARPLAAASDLDELLDLTPRSPGVASGLAPMRFGRPGLVDQFREGRARGLIVSIPVEHANHDRSTVEMILLEYAPGRWYPMGAKISTLEGPERSPSRRPRPN